MSTLYKTKGHGARLLTYVGLFVTTLTRLPAIIHQVRAKVSTDLSAYLQKLFDFADDELFNLADKAVNNCEQNVYFDAMREVRMQRRTIENNLLKALNDNFSAILGDCAGLVISQDAELYNLRNQLINMARNSHRLSESTITLKMSMLLPVNITVENNPIGVASLCDGYLHCVEQLNVDLQAKIILVKLFQRCVLSELGATYTHINQLLDTPNEEADDTASFDPDASTSDEESAIVSSVVSTAAVPTVVSAYDEPLKKQAKLHEKRLLDAESRKANADRIKNEVTETLHSIIAEFEITKPQLPDFVQTAVFELWCNVMFLTWMQHGEDSDQWQEQKQTVRDLMVSLFKSDEDGAALMKMLPNLLQRLRLGFDSITCDVAVTSLIFKQLESEHLAIMTGQVRELKSIEPTPAVQDESADAELASVWLDHVDSLSPGMWFVVFDNEVESYRCRLAAAMKSFDKYLFVNRNGQKVLEKSRIELARCLEQGTINVLSSERMFDLALESVICDVRSSRGSAAK
jgi:hypothetical protein